MANENKDIIRVFALEANLSTTLIAGQFGAASDSNKLAVKKLSDSSIRFWSDDSKQVLLAGAQTITGEKTFTNAGLHILDTNSSHDLIIKPGSDLTADRTLSLATGDADRTITLNGNPTLNDWFDQSVKTTVSPTFVGTALSGLTEGQVVFPGAGGVLSGDADLFWDDSAKRLGIGTASPGAKLHVNGGQVLIRGAVTKPSALRIDPDITGTGGATQLQLMDIGATGLQSITTEDNSITYSNIASLYLNQFVLNKGVTDTVTNASTLYIQEPPSGATNNYSLFVGSGTSRFDGDVGIGTASPGAKLDVRGSAVFNEDGADVDFRIEGDTEQNLFFVDASTDRIGIGTNTPTALLHIDVGVTPTNAILLDMAEPTSGTEARNSHDIIFRGTAFQGAGETHEWKLVNNMIAGEGIASQFKIQYKDDGGSFVDKLEISGAIFLIPIRLQVGGEVSFAGTFNNVNGYGVNLAQSLTATSGTTMAHFRARASGGSLTTEDNSVTYSHTDTMWLNEPNISKGATDTITSAATLRIENAPTEGDANYAINVVSGLSKFQKSVFGGTDVVSGFDVQMRGTGLFGLSTDTVTASSTDAQGEAPMTASINRITSVPDSSSSVTAPDAKFGAVFGVVNEGNFSVKMYPASGQEFREQDIGVPTSKTIQVGQYFLYICLEDGFWHEITGP